MPRICYITGKWSSSWQTRSHSMRAGKRQYKKNLIYRYITLSDGSKMRVKISSKMYKKMKGFI